MGAADSVVRALVAAALTASLMTAAASAASIQQFLSDPAALLKQFPNGGAQLVAQVRDLAASDHATLKPIIGLLGAANKDQATAIGTALGQVALATVKTDQAYANQIQQAIAGADLGASANAASGPSSQPRIGSAVTTKDQVDGVTESGTQPITVGTNVYRDELVVTGSSGMAQLLFADRTNLSIGPVTEIRLDKFVYDPDSKGENVVVVASQGAFRFITGVQHSESYTIKTPYATLGVRGTEFIVLMNNNEEQVQLNRGQVVVTTISNKVVTMDTPDTVLSVDSQGNTQGPSPSSQPLVNFAALGAPVTNSASSDAMNAFAAATGNSGIGSTGGAGGGGGGEAGTGQSGGVGGGADFAGPPNLQTTVTNPGNLLLLNTPPLGGGAPVSPSAR